MWGVPERERVINLNMYIDKINKGLIILLVEYTVNGHNCPELYGRVDTLHD